MDLQLNFSVKQLDWHRATEARANEIPNFQNETATCDAGVAALGFPAVISGDVPGSCLTVFSSDFTRPVVGFPAESFWWGSPSEGGATNSAVSLLFAATDVAVSPADKQASHSLTATDNIHCLFCSLAVHDARVGHTMDLLSPFISVLCHSDWLFHGESCPRLDVVRLGRAWPSSPACTWHCSLHYLFLHATPLFPHGVTIVC